MQGLTKEVKEQMLIDADDINTALAAIKMALNRDRSQSGETLEEEIDDHVDWIHQSLERILTAAGAIMANKAMKRKIENGEAVNIANCPVEDGRYYRLAEFHDGLDYCDGDKEHWIWSIGRRKSDGVILASTDSVFYQNPEYECLFLR